MKTPLLLLIALTALALTGCDALFPKPVTSTQETGAVTGRALYEGQTDSSGIVVSLEALDSSGLAVVPHRSLAAQSVTLASGAYTLSGLAAGHYTLYASSPDSTQGAVHVDITIEAGRTLTAGDLLLTATGSIAGTVTLQGSPAQGLMAYVAGTSYAAWTKADGTYTITGVPAGTGYTLVAHQDGYTDVTKTVDVAAASATAAGSLDLTAVAAPGADVVSLTDTTGAYLWGSSSLDPAVHQARTVQISATVPGTGGDVFYLLTNTSRYTDRSLAEVDLSAPSRSLVLPQADPRLAVAEPSRPLLRDLPGLEQRGIEAWQALRLDSSRSATVASPAPTTYAVGDALTFIDALWSSAPTSANEHPSHLRAQVVKGTHRLNVWVSDDAWDATGSGNPATPATGLSHGVSQAMVNALANKFLNTSTNAIYEWVTGLFGSEWPASGVPTGGDGQLINGGGQINIFLTNLNPGGTADGVLMGYYHSLNNLVGVTGSNEKILFAIDADSLANPYDATSPLVWSINDYWPAEIVSTLAHEFQHMIEFYQKQVKNQVYQYTDPWINEMASMAAEDLVADKLGVPGPRGVDPTDYSVGLANNGDGRLPLFNYWHETIPLTRWGDNMSVLRNYSSSYAFGAWLLRNYGGPALFRDIVTNRDTDYHAVVNAVRRTTDGKDQTWESLVRDWGLATFMGTSAGRAGLNYATDANGGKYQWVTAGGTYATGSINPWNYTYSSYAGPYIYTANPASWNGVAAGATYFQYAGFRTGSFTATLSLPADVAVTVVAIPQ